MIKIEDAVKICDNYRRFYNIAVDCKTFIDSKDEEERIIIFRQPRYIDYIHSGTVDTNMFFSKRILCDKIMLFIKYSNFIKNSNDLIIVDKNSPDLFELIILMTNIISKTITDQELKVIEEIIKALKKGYNLNSVTFETEEEKGLFNWCIPFIYMFWITQDENGLIKINTNEAMELLIHENRLLTIVQQESIKYKQEIINAELSKTKKVRK